MPILRYTCTACGLVTRVEAGDSHRACACKAPFVVVDEDEEKEALDAE